MFTNNLDSILKVFTKTMQRLEQYVEKEQAEIEVQRSNIEEAQRVIDTSTVEINRANRAIRKLGVILSH